jgi:membrane protease YdiL (CAAX protease family)
MFTALATGISEEILSRGFVLKRLYEDSKNILTSSFFASILFFFLHVPILFTNIKLTGNLLLFFMVTDIILSLFNSFVFLIRKSLFLPIFIHALYNITLLLFI